MREREGGRDRGRAERDMCVLRLSQKSAQKLGLTLSIVHSAIWGNPQIDYAKLGSVVCMKKS